MQTNTTRFWLTALAVALVLGACNRDAADSSPPERAADEAPAAERSPLSEEGPRLAGPPTGDIPVGEQLAEDKRKKKDKKKEPAGEAKKDYWAKIHFTGDNFEEVREYVKTYYIDSKVDESRAYVEAANFALMEMEKPAELLPANFHKKRAGHADEEGRLDGKTYQLEKKHKYLIHVVPDKKKGEKEKKKKKKKRLTDDEIRAHRAKAEKRRHLLEDSWSGIDFGEAQFKEVLAHIRTKLKPAVRKNGKKAMKKYWVAAAQGYLYSLDPHSSLVSSEAWEESTRNTTDSSFEGIGAILTQRNEETIVESPIEGRPAAAAGMRAGDVITKVDGESIGGLPLHKVVKRIRGPKGTVVKLSVRREGDPEEKVYPIKRAHIDIKNVSGRLLDPHHPGIGYIKVTGFVPTTTEEIKSLYEKLQAENKRRHDGAKLRGIVFDLRNNSGGLLAQGVKVADLFLEKGVIVEVKNRVRRDEVYRARQNETWNIPLIVLVNDGSASASEIVASAIQDNKRGLLVGDRTFGKASVQTLFSPILRKDYYIKLTIARYFSPSGRTIQVVGVRPDFDVAPDVGKKMPVGFREENLSHYLKPISAQHDNPMKAVADKVAECTEVRGIAEKIHANDPHPKIKFDYQLMKAADYMECFIDQERQAVR